MTEFVHYLPGILLAYGVVGVGLLSPGPNILAVMGTSMSVNRPAGMSLAMGVAFGSFCWAVITASGLTAIIATYAWFLTAVKIVGGCYLLYLAFKAFRAAASKYDLAAEAVSERNSLSAYFWRGLIVQMTNPKAAFAWIATISLGLEAHTPIWVAVAIVIGSTFLSVFGHAVYALVFSTPPMVRIYGKARRTIQIGLGSFFAFAGIKMLTSRT